MTEKPFSEEEEHQYWIDRHREFINSWEAVGFRGGEQINQAFYECRRQALRTALSHNHIKLQGARVLDVGCGIGIFSKFYHEAGAEVYGIDISPESVAYCNSQNIGTFIESSIADLVTKVKGPFDIIHCFDVLYHLTDEGEWKTALEAFSALSKTQTVWFITEIHTSKDYVSSSHIIKRSTTHYRTELKKGGHVLDTETPLYWLYSASPRIARRFPRLISASNRLGVYFKNFMQEYAALWTVRNTKS